MCALALISARVWLGCNAMLGYVPGRPPSQAMQRDTCHLASEPATHGNFWEYGSCTYDPLCLFSDDAALQAEPCAIPEDADVADHDSL